MADHDAAEGKYGVHRSIFQIFVFLNLVYVCDRKLPHRDGAYSITNQNQRDYKSKGKRTQHTVDGE